jgi:hypothetical protein
MPSIILGTEILDVKIIDPRLFLDEIFQTNFVL